MRRFWTAVPCVMMLAGCTIEPTPQQYIDRQPNVAEQIALSEAGLTERLTALPGALARREVQEIDGLLGPNPEGRVILPDFPSPSSLANLAGVLERSFGGRQWVVGEVSVTTGPQNNVAWFTAVFRSADSSADQHAFMLSGVFRRLEGSWQLAQAHLSIPADSLSAAISPAGEARP